MVIILTSNYSWKCFTWVFWLVELRGKMECIRTLSKRKRIQVILSGNWVILQLCRSLDTEVLCCPHPCSLSQGRIWCSSGGEGIWNALNKRSFLAQSSHNACNLLVGLFLLTELWHVRVMESIYLLWQDVEIISILGLNLISKTIIWIQSK